MTEMGTSLDMFIKHAQEIAFQQEMPLLRKNQQLPGSSKLKQFSPFIDLKRNGVVRVGGRLRNTPVDYVSQHPILLPSDQQVTVTIVWDHHRRHWHLKTELLLHSLRQQYWIISGRRVGQKNHQHRCIIQTQRRPSNSSYDGPATDTSINSIARCSLLWHSHLQIRWTRSTARKTVDLLIHVFVDQGNSSGSG